MTRKAKRWSARVTLGSNALDLENRVFKKKDAKSIARSLKRSAEHSRRRKSSPYRSAMSMLTFYINRAGSNLSKSDRAKLERAKDELRRLYGKVSAPAKPRAKAPTATRRRRTATFK
ncbi:MAG TPA: DUF3175 domain-containing protein [Thermoanaerobaculia bacterium]|nr:DUF3175 domain-containing protein [Thermoanaerobaculia bacterium]